MGPPKLQYLLGYIDVAVGARGIIAIFSGMNVTTVDDGDGHEGRGIISRREEILPHGQGPIHIVFRADRSL